jgi:hypothetical protein
LYAVKFQNNPQSARSLATEFLATRLAFWLDLPVPKVGVIQVSDWMVTHDLLRIETDNRLTRCASGRQLALQYMPDSVESLPQQSLECVTNRDDFIRVLPFDQWTANCDNRQAVFVRQGKREYHAVFIDQHYCFDGSRWAFPNLPHHGIYEHRYIYRNVSGWQWFEPTLSRIAKLSRFDIWKFATEVPPEWFGHDTEAISRLVERLFRRRVYVRDLIANLHNSGRNLFPNWPMQ